MKTKAILLFGAVALVTLSFTFVGGKEPAKINKNVTTSSNVSEPVGGLFADVVE
jgi:hypothetical protein